MKSDDANKVSEMKSKLRFSTTDSDTRQSAEKGRKNKHQTETMFKRKGGKDRESFCLKVLTMFGELCWKLRRGLKRSEWLQSFYSSVGRRAVCVSAEQGALPLTFS